MKVQVKYFAGIREALGKSGETIETSAATLGLLRAQLVAQGGAYGDCLARGKALRMALNQEMRDEDAALTLGDEVAFFPPVTGG